jgi:FixJ family two-component response regulator
VSEAARALTIHVVDDDDDVRNAFSRLLRSAGLGVRAYGSAQSFLDQASSSAPGCILLDVTMPGLTGPDVLARLRERENLLPVIVVSARDNEATHTLVRALGAKMFLRKPVDDQALLDAISWITQVRLDR